MSTVTLHLSDKIERQLQALATQSGQEAAAVALDILEKSLDATAPTQNPNELPYEIWRERFEAWIKEVPQVNLGFVDDSRESIYEER